MNDTDLKTLTAPGQTIAVVGLSPNPDRASHEVARYLQEHGFRVVPVRPGIDEILGQKAYARLEDIPEHVDIVDVFRKAEDTPPVAESAVRIGAGALWLQLGIENEVAASIAATGGLQVVQNRCMKLEHQRLWASGENGSADHG